MTITTWIAASVIVSFAGPFDTFGALPILARFVFWGTTIGASILLGSAVCEYQMRKVGPDNKLRADVKAVVIFPLLFGPMLWAACHLVVSPGHQVALSLPQVILYTFLITVAVTYLRHLLGVLDTPAEPEPLLIRRFEGLTSDQVARISGRDHYVDVHTSSGEVHSTLMRFSDALNEIEGMVGVRVHRSHWVAKNAVRAVEREKGRVFLRTADEARVPVSRGFRETVEAEGLI